jgi:ribonuclease-3
VGDAVIGLLVADALFRADPATGPGPLTTRRAEIVSTRGLAGWARELGLGRRLRLGRGEEQGGGRDKDSVLATALEAVVGAVYLAAGLERAAALVARLLPPGAACPGARGDAAAAPASRQPAPGGA